ncbi:MAG TPA: hypothetical protein VE396_18695 [Xanthobacteraceae bacterium]|nr:hypothetical protein [Xanthobacteraceae bacterium]
MKFARIAFLGAVAALAVCANLSAARAGDDEDSNLSFTDKFLRTLGVKNPNETEYEINYSERSPLVVPPNRNLPPPAASGAPAANWPKDPDIAKRKQAKNDDKPVIRQYDAAAEADRALRPDELNSVSRDTRTVAPPGTSEQSEPVNPPKKSIFSLDFLKKEEYATFTGEPARAALTDPPPGYLTPSPNQPYGIAPEHKAYVPKTLGERVEPVR